jgi:hypothetical protein
MITLGRTRHTSRCVSAFRFPLSDSSFFQFLSNICALVFDCVLDCSLIHLSENNKCEKETRHFVTPFADKPAFHTQNHNMGCGSSQPQEVSSGGSNSSSKHSSLKHASSISDDPNFDYTFRIIVVGDAGAQSSRFVYRYTDDQYVENIDEILPFEKFRYGLCTRIDLSSTSNTLTEAP